MVTVNKNLAEFKTRAAGLFAAGYTATHFYDGIFIVITPEGVVYNVDSARHTCECDSFRNGQYVLASGKKTCKHLHGLKKLVLDHVRQMDSDAGAYFCRVKKNLHGNTLDKSDLNFLRMGCNPANVLAPGDAALWQKGREIRRASDELIEAIGGAWG